MVTWTPEEELAELERELARERFALRMSERADRDGRVCDTERWAETLERRREKIARLEDEAATYRALVAA